jgi:hypothetical protein
MTGEIDLGSMSTFYLVRTRGSGRRMYFSACDTGVRATQDDAVILFGVIYSFYTAIIVSSLNWKDVI